MNLHNKRAQGMPINFIILVVLGLLILIVILVIIGGKVTVFKKSTDCHGRSGKCFNELGMQADESCPSDRPIKLLSTECPITKEGKKEPGTCCLPIGG